MALLRRAHKGSSTKSQILGLLDYMCHTPLSLDSRSGSRFSWCLSWSILRWCRFARSAVVRGSVACYQAFLLILRAYNLSLLTKLLQVPGVIIVLRIRLVF